MTRSAAIYMFTRTNHKFPLSDDLLCFLYLQHFCHRMQLTTAEYSGPQQRLLDPLANSPKQLYMTELEWLFPQKRVRCLINLLDDAIIDLENSVL